MALLAVGFMPTSFEVPPSSAIKVEAIGMTMETTRSAGLASRSSRPV